MKQKLLNSFKLKATLLVALLCAVCTGAWATDIALTTEAITIDDFSPVGSSYLTTATNKTIGGYTWSVYQCMNLGKYSGVTYNNLQMKSGVGSLTSPTITSSNGFTVTVTYSSSKALTLQIGSETAQTGSTTANNNQAGTGASVTATTTSTSTSFKLSAGSAVAYVSSIVITPTAASGPTTYTVTYDANGGTGTLTDEDSPYNSDATVTVLDNAFTRTGFDFSGWNTAANGSGTGYAAGATFTITGNTTLYAQWTASSLASISVNTSDATTKFRQGEAFTSAGVVVTATYENGSSQPVSANFSTPNMSQTGEQTITVTYEEGGVEKTTTYTINVYALSSITLSGEYPTTFNQGATFSSGDIVVTGHYDDDGDELAKDVTEDAEFSGYNLSTPGEQTVTVSYGGKSATYTITVNEYVQPTNFDINLNDTFFGTSYGGSASGITDANPESGSLNNVIVTYAGSGNHYINSSQIRFYPNNKLTFTAPSGYNITKIVFTSAGTWAATINANDGTYTTGTKTWTGEASSVIFTGSGSSRCDISKATVTLAAASTDPSITVDETTVDVLATTDDYGIIGITYANLTISDESDFDIQFYDAEGNDDDQPSWIEVGIVKEDGDYYVYYLTLEENTSSEARSAYFKVYALDDTDFVYSDLITLTQDKAVVDLTYKLASSITSGKHYIIVSKNDDDTYIAMGGQKTNNRAPVEVDVEGETATFKSDAGVTEFVINGPYADGNYTIYDANIPGYLYAASSSANHLKTQETNNDNGLWRIEINDGSKIAGIVAQGSNTRNVMQYNYDNSLFSCYAEASMYDVYLYEKDDEDDAPKVNVTVSDAGYATFASEIALDFTGKSIKAYIAKFNDDKDGVVFTQVSKVPANTGVLLYANGGATEDIPALNGGANDVTGNVFVPVLETIDALETDAGGNTNFILNKVGGVIGFYWSAGQKVAAGKAYISVPASSVKSFIALPGFEDETAINDIVNGQSINGKLYNLAGQRVNKAQKGIFIVNGKKVVK